MRRLRGPSCEDREKVSEGGSSSSSIIAARAKPPTAASHATTLHHTFTPSTDVKSTVSDIQCISGNWIRNTTQHSWTVSQGLSVILIVNCAQFSLRGSVAQRAKSALHSSIAYEESRAIITIPSSYTSSHYSLGGVAPSAIGVTFL